MGSSDHRLVDNLETIVEWSATEEVTSRSHVMVLNSIKRVKVPVTLNVEIKLEPGSWSEVDLLAGQKKYFGTLYPQIIFGLNNVQMVPIFKSYSTIRGRSEGPNQGALIQFNILQS